MELPIRCSCGETVMVDLENLEIRPISKLYVMEFFICQHCEREEVCWFTTPLFEENLRKLINLNPNNPAFQYHFSKAIKRAQEIQRRGQELYGSIRI